MDTDIALSYCREDGSDIFITSRIYREVVEPHSCNNNIEDRHDAERHTEECRIRSHCCWHLESKNRDNECDYEGSERAPVCFHLEHAKHDEECDKRQNTYQCG
ncbi:Uncharacterised protein [Arcanobacterium haemolyticum]|nr:Uncharacterised protein [Arcanobacterium haemolyticum]